MDQRSENKFRKENKMKLLLTSLLSLAFTCLIAADSVKIEFNRKNFDESEKLPKNFTGKSADSFCEGLPANW